MIRKLTVSLHHSSTRIVGALAIRDRKIYFEYDPDFLESGIELSPYKLPLKAGVQRCDDDVFEGLWGLFADSLPDGWGRLLMDRHLTKQGVNPHTLTPMDRLAYVGKHAMGALSYRPETASEPAMERIVLDDLARNSAAILRGSSDAMLDELLALGGSSAGARPKVLVQLSDDRREVIHGRQALKEGFSHWMVKFASSADLSGIGAVEYAYSLMAGAAGVEMPETALLEGKRGRYFAAKRFDRMGDKRVHMHSASGLVHADFRYPTLDYDDLLALTLHLTKDLRELRKAFRLACFNLFAHNRDDHAKNFSFLMDEKGSWRFAPAYDLTFSYGPGGEHSTTYLGEGKNPTERHLLELARKHGIKKAGEIVEEIRDAVGRWAEFAAEAALAGQTARQIRTELKRLAGDF
jgi:serine/threonine-protein kinase HipA